MQHHQHHQHYKKPTQQSRKGKKQSRIITRRSMRSARQALNMLQRTAIRLLPILAIGLFLSSQLRNQTMLFSGFLRGLTFYSMTTVRTPTLPETAFCLSIKGALADGPRYNETNNIHRRKMVHAFVSTSGHFSFLHNVLLSMQKSNLSWTPVVLAIDKGVCTRLSKENLESVLCIPYLNRLVSQLGRDEPESIEQIQPYIRKNASDPSKQYETIGNSFHGWGSVEHKFVINAKLYALRDILNCAVDAFITDTDISFRSDPRPYFEIPGRKGDIIAQNDTTNEYKLSLNSGFMYWRNTMENRNLSDRLIRDRPFWMIDQHRVNDVLHNLSTPHTLLDANRFPNGNMLNMYWTVIQNDVVVAHANWNTEYMEKQIMLEQAGLWYLNGYTASEVTK